MLSILIHIPCYKNIVDAQKAIQSIIKSYNKCTINYSSIELNVFITFTGILDEYKTLQNSIYKSENISNLKITSFYNGIECDAIDNWNKFYDFIENNDYYIPNHSDNYIDEEYFNNILKYLKKDELIVVVPSCNLIFPDKKIIISQNLSITSWLYMGVLIFLGKLFVPIECAYPTHYIKNFGIKYNKFGNIAWCSDILFFIDVTRKSNLINFAPDVITNFSVGNDKGITALASKKARMLSTQKALLKSLQDFNIVGIIIFLKHLLRLIILK